MNDDILIKITKFKKIQSKLDQIYEAMEKEDIARINDVWNDANADLFIENYKSMKKDIEKIKSEIDYTIELISKSFNIKEEVSNE